MLASSAVRGAVVPLPASHTVLARRPRKLGAYALAETEAKERQATGADGGMQQIYVGRGRYVLDLPEKYPDRTTITGGFAGGEVGLQRFLSEVSPQPKQQPSSRPAPAAKKPAKGLYIGRGRFRPDDGSNEARVIRDTGRDELVGGFTAGEVGLSKYLETGEVPLLPEGVRRKQQSPLIIAGVVSVAAVTGGILLTDVGEFGEGVLSGSPRVDPAALAGLDDNTKLLLEIAVLLVGAVGATVGLRALVASVTNRIKSGAARLGTLAVFWVVVFVAAKIVLDG